MSPWLCSSIPVRRVCVCTKTADPSLGRCLANDAMDLGDLLFGRAHLGRIEPLSRSNPAHGWQKRRLDKLLVGLD
jgi:hypothetical protein